MSTNPTRVSLSDFTLLKLLSTGGTSKVYLARVNTRSEHVALKVISKRDLSEKNTLYVLNEQAVQQRLTENQSAGSRHSPWFLPLITSWHDSECFYLATEYQRGGDMSVELMRCGYFEEDRARFYAAEIFLALQSLHSAAIVHRDIKPANILFAPDGHLILCDFGAARHFGETVLPGGAQDGSQSQMTDGARGTPLFMSPEQHRGEKCSFQVDYWALGVVLFRMLSGKMPFGRDTTNKQEIRRSVLEDSLSFHGFSPSPEAQDLLSRLLAKNPEERILAEQIPRHQFFAKIDWNSISSRSSATPWPPFLRFIPSNARTMLPIQPGASYVESQPFPEFFWCSPFENKTQDQDQAGMLKSFFSSSTQKRKLRKSRSLPLRVFNALSSTSSLENHPMRFIPGYQSSTATTLSEPAPKFPAVDLSDVDSHQRETTTINATALRLMPGLKLWSGLHPLSHLYSATSDNSSSTSVSGVSDSESEFSEYEQNSGTGFGTTTTMMNCSSLKHCLYSSTKATEDWKDAPMRSRGGGGEEEEESRSRYIDALTDQEIRIWARVSGGHGKRQFLNKVKAWIGRDPSA
ncbi:hypothetical protein D9757_003977 [Collybiopsis confluens]|uniref:non-specific serine/threonine protein kinase n=1 Tax=Collybiopsis confluens TaxID=2823264 RepID=A0A8H5HWN5_9AGAR|nr:hypothetical protein D9757_003977 [Collybiopsis confluens]